MDLFGQFTGHNNGALCAAWTLMQQRGWKSKETLARALLELREKGWIEVTRQGGRRKATLHAVTWLHIDECEGKQLDVHPTSRASNTWRQTLPDLTPIRVPKSKEVRRELLSSAQRAAPIAGAMCPDSRAINR
jgi:hypothetical protein